MTAVVPAREAAAQQVRAAASQRVDVRQHAHDAGVWLRSSSITVGRSTLTLAMIMRSGLGWERFWLGCGVAKRRTKRLRVEISGHPHHHGRSRDVIEGVPRPAKWTATPYGATCDLRLPIGHDLSTYAAAMAPLRHWLRIESAKVTEIPGRPGWVRLDLLRADPLNQVKIRPHAEDAARFVLGQTETARPDVLDFREFPHWLIAGATGSGKSEFLLAFGSSVATTDAVMVAWDLKWGLEAAVMGPRWSEICDTRAKVESSVREILRIAEARAELFKQHQVRNIDEFAEATGVQLRRIFLVVDEVAELALSAVDQADDLDGMTDADRAKAIEAGSRQAKSLTSFLLQQVLRVVQLVRFAGIHVIVCGQRFGSDLGDLITSIRAQLPGRRCMPVNDKQTAEMTLPGMDPEVHARAVSLHRPGSQVVKAKGGQWHIARCGRMPANEARRIAAATAHHAIQLATVAADDRARLAAADLTPTGDPR